jgi:hypothetical protein
MYQQTCRMINSGFSHVNLKSMIITNTDEIEKSIELMIGK